MSNALTYKMFWTKAGGKCPDSWVFTSIQDLLKDKKSISVGVMYPGVHIENGTPLVKVSNVKNGKISLKPDFFIGPEVNNEYKRTELDGSELLITLVGNPGDCVVVTEGMKGWNVARALAVVRLKKPELREWLRYVLLSKPVKHLIEARLNTTVQKTLNLKDVKELAIPLPDEVTRRKITTVIGAIEKKINLNEKSNQTLEAMAQALFKSWFVDFDPVKAKIAAKAAGADAEGITRAAMEAVSGQNAEALAKMAQTEPERYAELKATAELFPDALVESELGEIPKGWLVKRIEDIAKKISTGPFGSNLKRDSFIDFGVPVIRGGNLTNGFVDEKFVFVSEEKAETVKNSIAYHEDIVITHRGTLGQVGIIPSRAKFEKYIVSQSQMLISVDKNKLCPQYIYQFLCSRVGQHKLLANKSQTGVPAIARPTTSLKTISLIIPSFEINSKFDTLVNSIISQKDLNMISNQSFVELRDTLLPKLLSGELSVEDVELSNLGNQEPSHD